MSDAIPVAEGRWASRHEIAPGVLVERYWGDDPTNPDGSKPEGWRSAEEKAITDANGGTLGCCT